MNGYYQIFNNNGKCCLKIFPPTDGGEPVSGRDRRQQAGAVHPALRLYASAGAVIVGGGCYDGWMPAGTGQPETKLPRNPQMGALRCGNVYGDLLYLEDAFSQYDENKDSLTGLVISHQSSVIRTENFRFHSYFDLDNDNDG